MAKSRFNRRQVLKGFGASLGVLALRGFEVQAAAPFYFTHGVASGDPISDRVILWTRLLPGNGQHSKVSCNWQVAADADFNQIVSSGSATTSAQQDYTIKVDATGLSPNSHYFYRFIGDGFTSPVGRTRTLPVGDVAEFRLGVASCSNYPQGYFNAYRDMANTELDLVLHLGDYIYEYAEGVYANATATGELGRNVEPSSEILSIEDYRMRYGLYRTDVDLQAVHARHPFICVWDDHELCNDSWIDGAENHNEGEGDFFARARAARQAYHEWMPIRTTAAGDQAPIYRSFKLGNLADLIMLDTRQHGRMRPLDYAKDLPVRSGLFQIDGAGQGQLVSDAQAAKLPGEQLQRIDLPHQFVDGNSQPVTDYQTIAGLTPETLPKGWYYLPDIETFKQEVLQDESRTILGQDQESWLEGQLRASQKRGAIWQLLGQQVLMGKLQLPIMSDEELRLDQAKDEYRPALEFMQSMAPAGLPLNLDAWDGYAACRERVFKSLQQYASNPLVLAGDTHNAWAFNLSNNQGQAIGVEVGTPGINSPGLETYLPTEPEVLAKAIKAVSPELVATETASRGWSELLLTPEAITNQWHFVSTVLDRNYTVARADKQICKVGDKRFS